CLAPLAPGVRVALHSFPTRRSSDLPEVRGHLGPWQLHAAAGAAHLDVGLELAEQHVEGRRVAEPAAQAAEAVDEVRLAEAEAERSEEHTSELQSLAYLVCRLLLEKK